MIVKMLQSLTKEELMSQTKSYRIHWLSTIQIGITIGSNYNKKIGNRKLVATLIYYSEDLCFKHESIVAIKVQNVFIYRLQVYGGTIARGEIINPSLSLDCQG